jgi:5'-3' exonuclease
MPDTLLSPSGAPVNAIRGYLDMTARLIGMYSPNRIVACIEGDWRPSWRVELFPDYKANRLEEEGEEEEEPETLTPQIPVLLDLLDEFGIPMVGVDDYEADDVMATFAVQEKGPIRIVTGDRDLFQLVDDRRDVKVVYALFAMFRGDPSDGLPGVKGIGEKGAAIIANHFATVDEALAAARQGHSALTANLAKKIIEGADYLAIAPTLVHCAKDVALPQLDIAMPKAPKDLSKIYAMKDEYGLGASVDRLISALNW